jgi:hypothetical protein
MIQNIWVVRQPKLLPFVVVSKPQKKPVVSQGHASTQNVVGSSSALRAT